MTESLNIHKLARALESLGIRLTEHHAAPIEIVVCGGSALIFMGLVARTTTDVDVVALMSDGVLVAPVPMPETLLRAAREVAEDLVLATDWLNNGPSSGEGGLFQMGLPGGFAERLHSESYGHSLIVHFADRFDQIHFKLYAAADRGGYHIEDLNALAPSSMELETAARWAMTHDVSRGFASTLTDMLRQLGHEDVADRL